MPAEEKTLAALSTTSTEKHPTGKLRFHQQGPVVMVVAHDGMTAIPASTNPRILQQEWAIITFEGTRPQTRRTEWRDVPLVVE